jgi:hypothetical protein
MKFPDTSSSPLERADVIALLARIRDFSREDITALAAAERPVLTLDQENPERRRLEWQIFTYERRLKPAAAMRQLRMAANNAIEEAAKRAAMREVLEGDGGLLVAASEAAGDALCALWLEQQLSPLERRIYAEAWRSVAGDEGF